MQHTASELAADIGVPLEEISYLCAGINHMSFFLRFERNGQDLYPLIRQVIADGRVPDWNRVRYELLTRLNYFVTESSEHLSEYVPWFIKQGRPDLVEKFNIPLDEYLYRCQAQIKVWGFAREKRLNPGASLDDSLRKELEAIPVMPNILTDIFRSLNEMDELTLSGEYGALIIHSIETGKARVVYANVPNEGLIDNLPQGSIVEVPCLVDKNGLQPTRIGALPNHLAALMQTNINVQGLTVQAALTGNREHIYHAAMLDPHTAAELDLDQIWILVDDLIQAHGDWLPDYL